MDGACWMCFCVADIRPSRTWMSGSFESVRWNDCVHRLDLGLYSHPKEFWGGMESEHMLTPREKSPLSEKNSPQRRRIEPTTQCQAGQRAQHTTNELFRLPMAGYDLWPTNMANVSRVHHEHCKLSCLRASRASVFSISYAVYPKSEYDYLCGG